MVQGPRDLDSRGAGLSRAGLAGVRRNERRGAVQGPRDLDSRGPGLSRAGKQDLR